MARTKKRKAATVAGVSVLTAALLLGGTFAWQSISQMALNENRASVNPGARLHDDYSGNYSKSSAKAVTDVGVKRVYVENFTDEEDKVAIIARVRLDEYMEIGGSAGYKTVTTTENGNNVAPYTNGVVTVSETKENNGDVKITLTALPYTGYKVDSVTADTSNAFTLESSGVYTYTYTPVVGVGGMTTPVNIAVSFVQDTHNDYTGDTVDPAVSLESGADINKVNTWKTYIPALDSDRKTLKENTASAFRDYVTLNFGWDSKYDTKGIYYMPTFNKNKDSLTADINGTYAAGFSDYKEYTSGQTEQKNAVYDADSNTIDEGENAVKGLNYTEQSETHTATAIDKTKSKVISMAQWKDDYKMAPGDYWVYDTDGWAYWANLLEPETATGLFLSRNEMTGTPEDNWYYGMNVVGQFVTSEDIGSDTDTIGFYTNANENPSNDAKTLLGILTKLNDAPTTSLESGQTLDVTYLKNEAQPISLTAQDGTWIVSDETVLTLSENEDQTQVIATAHKPGNAIIIYTAPNGNIALTRITVDYATYTIEQGKVLDAEAKGIVVYDDDDKTQLRIKGYYTDAENDIYYQVSVGKSAFYNNVKIISLVMEEGVYSIGNTAFAYCSALSGTVDFPASIRRVETSVFTGTAITELNLNEGILKIGGGEFGKITKLKLPASATDIDGNFGGLLEEIEVADGNTCYVAENNVLYNKDKTELVYYTIGKKDTSFEIPNTIKSIPTGAFRGNGALQTVIIPEGVTSLGWGAFMQMGGLKELTIPASVTKLGEGICSGGSLQEIKVASANPNYKAVDGILYSKDGKTLYCCPGGKSGQVTIRQGTVTVAAWAFYSDAEITSLVIPKSVTSFPTSEGETTGMSKLTDIYYEGTQTEWEASSMSEEPFFKSSAVTIHYDHKTE